MGKRKIERRGGGGKREDWRAGRGGGGRGSMNGRGRASRWFGQVRPRPASLHPPSLPALASRGSWHAPRPAPAPGCRPTPPQSSAQPTSAVGTTPAQQPIASRRRASGFPLLPLGTRTRGIEKPCQEASSTDISLTYCSARAHGSSVTTRRPRKAGVGARHACTRGPGPRGLPLAVRQPSDADATPAAGTRAATGKRKKEKQQNPRPR